MNKREDRIKQILLATVTILSKEGAEQLSMRKVAKAAQLSLSNLQYYYKDRNILLTATVQYYFESCQEEITEALNQLKAECATSAEVFLRKLLNMLLINGKSSQQIMMFQEIWAMSSRNQELVLAIETYYKNYCMWMIDLISSFSKHPETIASLLVPYAEGYAVVSNILPLAKKRVIDMLVKVILDLG